MRYCFLLAWFSFLSWSAYGQAGDTTIYQVPERFPRFPGCESLDTTEQGKDQCAQRNLLQFVSQNVVYPLEAKDKGLQGTVVISFVVEKDGSLSYGTILKDIGGGCGAEALRMVKVMNNAGIKWAPGKVKGTPVRAKFNLPVKFKLEEPLPYQIFWPDTIYTELETPAAYVQGDEALSSYLSTRLKYPASYKDSCLMGVTDIQLAIKSNGDLRVLDVTDFSGLGYPFWEEAVETVTSTWGKWKIATYEGRPVGSLYNITLLFKPEGEKCKSVVQAFEKASTLADEGAALSEQGQNEQALQKFDQALQLDPNNGSILYLRGSVYLGMNKFPEACADLNKANKIALMNWYSDVLPLICR